MKNKMKNKMKKRILAGVMALAVGAGLTGISECCRPVADVHAEEGKKELKEAAEKVLGDSGSTGSETEICKEESVYVKADASGNVKKTTVTEWLKNPGTGDVSDVSGLSDIRNIKGEEAFTQGQDGKITWKSEGTDIYYQGEAKGGLPVEVRVSYMLDGKKISPEDLKGRNGKVEIHIDYINHSKETVNAGGRSVEMYTPFTMVTALMLPTEEYKNVTIDHGKVISDADKEILVGVGFPGLKENLNLQQTDMEIPESITITADVEHASVGPTITVASADVISKLELDHIADFEDLEAAVEELDQAAEKLQNGSEEAKEGAEKLADGSRELSEGADRLADGNHTLAGGMNALNQKSGELIGGVNSLALGVNQYAMGVDSLAQGSAALNQGAQEINQGAVQIQGGITGAKAGAARLTAGLQDAFVQISKAAENAAAGLQGVSDAAEGARAALASVSARADVTISVNKTEIVNAAMNAVSADSSLTSEQKAAIKAAIEGAVPGQVSEKGVAVEVKGVEQADAYLAGVQKGIGQIQAGMNEKLPALTEGMKALNTGAEELQGGLGTLEEGSNRLVAGTAELSGGAENLAAGAQALNERSSLLTAGTLKLQQGGSRLKEGVRQLADGADAASAGADALKGGASRLADGSQTLADGNRALADGMSEFKTSGIDKLTEIFQGDIRNLKNRLDAMTLLGKSYKSFAGIKEEMAGSTKFIIETDEV